MNAARDKRAITALIGVVLLLAGLFVGGLYVVEVSQTQSPLDKLAAEFSRVDGRGLHWDYDRMLAAYRECRDSRRRQRLLDLMVTSRAAHLVPDIIDSISHGGYGDTERQIRAIIGLTGHDFSEEFDITGIWQISDVNEMKVRLRVWWAENGQATLEARGPKGSFSVPNSWSSLTLSLATEKSRYVEVEPIRLTAVLGNRSDVWFTFNYKPRKPAFALEFLRVVDDAETITIADTHYLRHHVICGNARGQFVRPAFFVLDPGARHVMQEWTNNGYKNCLAPGKVTMRAVLTALHGEHKGKRLVSNDLQIDIVRPVGEDLAAHGFLTRTGAVDVGNGQRFGPGFVRLSGLVRNSGSSYKRPVDEYFVETYPKSIYAHYVRYTQASVATWYRGSFGGSQGSAGRYADAGRRVAERLEEIVANAPRDFPLLGDAYALLLEHYKKTGELDEMAAVAVTVALPELRVLDPALSKRLADLTVYPDKMVANLHRKGRHGRTSLHDAAEKGRPALVRFLIAKGADVHADSGWGTPLHVAAHAGREEIVEILLANGADVNAEHGGRTPLFWPVSRGQKDIVELLLANGADVNVADRRGKTLAENANLQKQAEVLQILITAKGRGGLTPLHWAVAEGRKAMVHMLLNNGAAVDVEDDSGQTPLALARALAGNDRDRRGILALLEEFDKAGE